jgi:hypothetical protein
MRAGVATSAYVLLLGLSLARLASRPGFAAGEAVAMIVLGLALSAAAFAVTRGAVLRPVVIRRAGRELAAITAYLAALAVGFLGWGLSAVRAAVAAEPAQSIALLAAKLAAMSSCPRRSSSPRAPPPAISSGSTGRAGSRRARCS